MLVSELITILQESMINHGDFQVLELNNEAPFNSKSFESMESCVDEDEVLLILDEKGDPGGGRALGATPRK